MRAHIVAIGNSRGVRIPKILLQETGLSDEVEMEVRDHSILIHSAKVVRAGWDEAFARMAETGDDELSAWADAAFADWDDKEWQW
jgi:antitoxin MazE